MTGQTILSGDNVLSVNPNLSETYFKPSSYTVGTLLRKCKGSGLQNNCIIYAVDLVSLTLNTGVHDMVPTDGTVVH